MNLDEIQFGPLTPESFVRFEEVISELVRLVGLGVVLFCRVMAGPMEAERQTP